MTTGEVPSMGVRITACLARLARRHAGALWVILADAAWHLAGQGWAFAVLACGMIWVAGRLPAAMAASDKAYALEGRLNKLVPNIPSPQPSPGNAGNNSYGPGNTSYTSGNSSYNGTGINITWNPQASTNDGGQNSTTSGQIGGAAAHYHSMTHTHASSVTMDSQFNTLRDAYSATVTAFNAHIADHGNLVNTVSALRADHSNLVSSHNTLVGTLANARVLR